MNIETKEITKKKVIIKFNEKDYECLNRAAELLDEWETQIYKAYDINTPIEILPQDNRMMNIILGMHCSTSNLIELLDLDDD